MSLLETFNLTKKGLGQYRSNYAKNIHKKIGKILEYRSVYAPIFQKKGKDKDLEHRKLFTFMFSARVKDSNFNNLVGSLSPIPVKVKRGLRGSWDTYRADHTYTTLLPYQTDATIVYIKKKGLFKREKGFFPFPMKIVNGIVSENDLFNSRDEHSTAFEIAVNMQKARFESSLGKKTYDTIKNADQTRTSALLNEDKKLTKTIKKLGALSDNIAQDDIITMMGSPIGITTILIPNGRNTLVQVGDLIFNPKLAVKMLNLLAISLRGSSVTRAKL